MTGSLTEREIEALLHKNVVGRIGCHAAGTTYVVPVSYAYNDQYIYVHSREGLKLQLMRQNPDVCFEVDAMINMASWQSVICQGQFEELTAAADRTAAANILLQRQLPLIASSTVKLTPNWPFGLVNSQQLEGVLFRIRLTGKTGRFEQG